MPGTTSIYGWPFQEGDDLPDGANLGEDLAVAIETTVDGIDDRVTTLEALAIELGRSPFARASSASNSSAFTSSEGVALTIASKTYKAGKAYELWVGGSAIFSANDAFSSWNLRKGNTAGGTVVVGLTRQPNGGANGTNAIHLNLRAIFVVGVSDVTTQLALTVAANGANTVTHSASGTLDRHVTILRAGDAADWTNAPVLS